jgi:hypothetical protein
MKLGTGNQPLLVENVAGRRKLAEWQKTADVSRNNALVILAGCVVLLFYSHYLFMGV